MFKFILKAMWQEFERQAYLSSTRLNFWMALAAIAAIIGAGMSAYSSYAQGQQQSRMASYNALIARQNADLALKKQELQKTQTKIIEKRAREETARTLSKQRSLYGKAGVQVKGSPLEVMTDTAIEGELAALSIRYAGSVEEANIMAQQANYKQQATIADMKGASARQAGNLGAGSELLSGIGQFANYMDK